MTLFGRTQEQTLLNTLITSKQAEFLAVYGRRRVGKTLLINSLNTASRTFFSVTGLKDGDLTAQLTLFANALSQCFLNDMPMSPAPSWMEAFEQLTRQMTLVPKNKKMLLFFDELPWLATNKSGLLQALDHYWNTRWSTMPNVKLIVCGSAASWMLDHLINAKGGLHNRITRSLKLEPFDLSESQGFLNSRGIKLSSKQVLDLYMVTGGVPFYLEQIDKRESVVQNIQRLCFTEQGLLWDEFPRLFRALFSQAETNLKLITHIAQTRSGLSREALIKATKIPSGGNLNKRLTELEASGFITRYVPYGHQKRNTYYRVVDEYTLFYLSWIAPWKASNHSLSATHWLDEYKKPAWSSWAGFAFEGICLKHVEQIRAALKLNNIGCRYGSWRLSANKAKHVDGTQIDLLIDRDDEVITLCEIKYSQKPFVIDKAYGKNLMHKIDSFSEHTKTPKRIMLAMITTQGIKTNLWSEELVQLSISLDDIMRA